MHGQGRVHSPDERINGRDAIMHPSHLWPKGRPDDKVPSVFCGMVLSQVEVTEELHVSEAAHGR